MPTSVVVSCPACHTKLKLKNQANLGRRKDCPRCGQSFVLQAVDKTSISPSHNLPGIDSRRSRRKRRLRIRHQQTALIAAGCVLVIGIAVCGYALSGNKDQSDSTTKNQLAAAEPADAEPPSSPSRTNDVQEKLPVQEQFSEPEPILETPAPPIVEKSDQPNQSDQSSPNLVHSPQPEKPASSEQVAQRSRNANPTLSNTGDNWPRFRGPGGLGVTNEIGLPLEWSATRNILWQKKLPGPGSSSPIIWGDHVYVTCYTGYGASRESPGDKADLKRHLLCLNRETGRILWSKAESGGGIVHPGTSHQGFSAHGYATHTPVADASGIYVFFGPSGVFAYSHSGAERWRKSVGTNTTPYGSCMSPILYRDLLIVNADVECGSIIAFDKRTGRERWRQGKNKMPGTSATPAVLTLNGKPQLVYCNAPYGSIAALDPVRGITLWKGSLPISRINVCPIAHDNVLFFTGNPVSRSSAIQIGTTDTVKSLWSLNKGSYISSPIYHDGHFYWAKDQGGIVYCVNAKTGKIRYETRLRPHSGNVYASPVLAEGRLYFVSQNRGVYVLRAKPEFELLAHNTIETDKTIFNGSPAVSRGRLFLRSNQSLYCIGETR